MQTRHNPTQQSTNVQADRRADEGASLQVSGVGSRRVIPVGNAREIIVRPRVPTGYKLLLGLSLLLNAVALGLLLIFGLMAYRYSQYYQAFARELAPLVNASPAAERLQALRGDPAALAAYTVGTARQSTNEALAAVRELEGATIKTTVAIDRQLPLSLQVPIDTDTTVTTSAPVNVVAPARITFPGGGGYLNTTASLTLPPGAKLPIRLALTVPFSTTVPVKFDVPVTIPLQQTDLAGPFARLRKVIEPAAQFFGAGQR